MIEIRQQDTGELLLCVPADTLARADLRGAKLPNADLRKADLHGAVLAGADLRGASLARAGLKEADLTDAILENANLGGANLSNAKLVRADLNSTNLVHANMTGADLSFADLAGADIRGACLVNTTLEHASFRGTRIDRLTDWGDHEPPWASRHPWRGIEADQYDAWDEIASSIFSAGPIEPRMCPSCGQAPLRFFFQRHRLGDVGRDGPISKDQDSDRGGFWIWCPACHRKDHASVRVPTWWQDVLEYPEDLRT